ncbi:sodium/hydrogen exchanger 9B2-like [Octopus sinensis]|uniref:Sodium/hydrogen exchanger 9B2-like n=1 Tax=Octopus sinensis TaxID=2607531 RepID=A0A6P7TK24_9MOLL|nr:sodium/hydrogen exchanger 9B2-like [Octopus sinensis]XP_036370000.1 sodium/hydrogen exchanger 9B2-like [Octopus sinensis]XP_036370001.1 sodium/hydrogen exchanger 9B2-like [Octopus sinensis]
MTTHTGVTPSSPGPRKSFIGDKEGYAEDEIEQQKLQMKSTTRASSGPCFLFCHRVGQSLNAVFGRAENPLPENPTRCQRFKNALMCPPQGLLGLYITSVLMFALLFVALVSILGSAALPGSNIFALWVVFTACITGGYIIQFLKLPPLLGMLIVGIMLRNVPYINVAKDVESFWAATVRNTALTVILIRAGLGLNPVALRKLSFAVIRLAFCPCLAEALVATVASHFFLGQPWIWGLMLGFVIAAVSPAVVVPCLLHLKDNGYGIDKGIPTLVIAAASIDDVLAITGFGVVLGIAFSEGNIVWSIFKGPLEALLGIVLGALFGVLLWYIPPRKQNNSIFLRGFLLYAIGLAGVLGSPRFEMPGTGPLLCLTVAFVAAFGWRKKKELKVLDFISNSTAVLWLIFQPLLFGLIGAEVEMDELNMKTIGYGIATLCVGLLFRTLVAYLAVCGTDLLRKEKLFVALAWLPKATVQAAIGSVALSTAREKKHPELEAYGLTILEVAVLVILITAPIGSALVMLTGPRLLKKTDPSTMSSENLKAIKSEANDEMLERNATLQESTKM